jgi:hypothetical protein
MARDRLKGNDLPKLQKYNITCICIILYKYKNIMHPRSKFCEA